MSLLSALLGNESGGRNIANTDQGTSSGQAQGYFQITTGTWDDFGGRKYASTPLGASYAQQADIASKIPLKRWDSSTLAAMRATGKPINTSLTLGQNLAMNGENFGSSPSGGTTVSTPQTAVDGANASQGAGGQTGASYAGSFLDWITGNLPGTSATVTAPGTPDSGTISSILGAVFGGIQKISGASSTGPAGGAIAGNVEANGDPNAGAIGSILHAIAQVFTVEFWQSAAAIIIVLLLAAAFLIFGAKRLLSN